MTIFKNHINITGQLLATLSILVFSYIIYMYAIHGFLIFSDSAKFADIARSLIGRMGYGSSFSFWGTNIFSLLRQNVFPAPWVSPVMPFSIVIFFKIFGINDLAVVATSLSFFVLTLIFTFLLGKKIFKSNLVGVLSTLVVGFNSDLINYATNGASEAPFIFEIVAATYFASIKKKWAMVVTLLLLILCYFTRPQAFIYIAGILFFWLLNNFKIKKAVVCFIVILALGLLVDRLVLTQLTGKYFMYSVTGRGVSTAIQVTSGSSASDSLRGDVMASSGIATIAKKVFYNLYNFFKLLPQIMSPYLFGLFVISVFRWGKEKVEINFKIAAVFMTLVTFLVTAASIPFFRYLHPVVPLIYIIAVGTLVEILNSIISKQTLVILASTFLIFLFGVGQTLGMLILDSRFERNTYNIGKPPVYVELSKILKENTNPNDIVITNLDTWGSWYGERRTVWFPMEPKQLIDPAIGKIPFDVIYLTSYKIDDENYYMGKDWRLIFDNPNDSKKWVCDGCTEIVKEYKLKNVYTVSASDDYERQDTKAILLVRK
jgi:4-amino-4-deoxy-L-arabinose transferase-like glycosyltransferase